MKHENSYRKPAFAALTSTLMIALSACNWVDSAGRQNNIPPEIIASIDNELLSDQQAVAIEDSGSLDIDFSDSADSDGVVVSFTSVLVDQGKLESCEELIRLQDAANLIGEACDSTVSADECSLTILNRGKALGDAAEPGGNADSQFTLLPPPLTSPIGLTYRWTAVDNDGGETSMHLTFCLESDNEFPKPMEDFFNLAYNSELLIPDVEFDEDCTVTAGSTSLLANDEDHYDNGECIHAELVSLPQYAANNFAAEFTQAGGFRYVHSGLYGISDDSFSYRLIDGEFISDPVTVSLDINIGSNLPPIANDDIFSVDIDSQNVLLNVADNDSDPEQYPLTVSAITTPDNNATAAIASEGRILYTPQPGFSGLETFSYTITDAGSSSASANISVYVDEINQTPIAVDDAVSARATDWTFFQVLENDSDPDPGDELKIVAITKPDNRGKLVIDAGRKMVIYRARRNFSGIETFTYTIADEEGETSTATVSVSVTP